MVYEDYKIYGPYFRKDGRQHIIAIHPEEGRKTVSYPKYLMECKLGRYLDPNETIDHIDNDPCNNNFSNLRVLSREEHSELEAKRLKAMKFKCLWCGHEFELKGKQLHDRFSSRRKGASGPFCSKSCSGKYGVYIQKGGIKYPSDIFDVEYERLKDH